MVGDDGAAADGAEGLAFLDRYLAGERDDNGRQPNLPPSAVRAKRTSKPLPMRHAVDAGAGVGRLTKTILLKRYDAVNLVEADDHLSKRSRAYLGRKRADRCTFTCARLESLSLGGDGTEGTKEEGFGNGSGVFQPRSRKGGGGGGGGTSRNPSKSSSSRDSVLDSTSADLVWLQWTLQYLTDADAVRALRSLADTLVADTGVLIIKENRPYGLARTDRFQMDTPVISGRYDITRTDDHHRLLFEMAGLAVDVAEEGEETNTYALVVKPVAAAAVAVAAH